MPPCTWDGGKGDGLETTGPDSASGRGISKTAPGPFIRRDSPWLRASNGRGIMGALAACPGKPSPLRVSFTVSASVPRVRRPWERATQVTEAV